MFSKLKSLRHFTLFLLIALSLGLLFYIYSFFTDNRVDVKLNKSRQLGVQLALVDDKNDNRLSIFSQLLIIPEHRLIVLYFLNTNAYSDDDPLWERKVNDTDSFPIYTDVANEYFITVTKTDAIRLINLAEGFVFYNAEKIQFLDQQFNYFEGEQYWSGEQTMEYALGKRKYEKKSDVNDFDIDRLYRQETVLLSLLWNLPNFMEKTRSKMGKFMYSLIDTNLTISEMTSFLNYIANLEDNHIKVLEVPMGFSTIKGKNEKVLKVKPEQARLFFKQFREDLALGAYISTDNISYEILNGTETNRIAHRLRKFLQIRNINVLGVGNYPYKPIERTFFLNHSGHTFSANYFMSIFKLPRERIFFRRAFIEISERVIVGNDMNTKTFRLKEK